MTSETPTTSEVFATNAFIMRAKKWRTDHAKHVERLEAAATHSFPPCQGDMPHPELWKAGSWKWFRESFPENATNQ